MTAEKKTEHTSSIIDTVYNAEIILNDEKKTRQTGETKTETAGISTCVFL